ncbi:MAG: M20 family metallopeptidase [Clostridiales bacterium]|nr:M20 family metallopeptidase [Clostridiales bacterium]
MEETKLIDSWIDSHINEMISDLSLLVSIKSVKGTSSPDIPFGEGPAKALNEALRICSSYGFFTKNHDNYVGTADLNQRETTLDILAHLDVVDEGEGWTSNPYRLTVKDGYLYGRGTADDKGPAIAVLYAMRAVKESGITLKYNTRLIMGTDEESGSRDLEHYFMTEKSAPHTFTPDCAFPVYNIEKGGYKPLIRKTWDLQTVLPRVVLFKGGYRLNVLPAEAEAVVAGITAEELSPIVSNAAAAFRVTCMHEKTDQGIKITVRGKSAHAASPEEGNNGLTALIGILAALPLSDCPSTQALRQLNEVFPHGDNHGKAAGIAMKDDISGDLTIVLSLMTMNEHGLTGRLDGRIPISANDDNCKAVFEKRLKSLGFSVEGEMTKPHHTPADSPFIRTLLNCYERYTGKRGSCLSMGGGTYVHDIEGGVAFGATMPGFQSNIHGSGEHIALDDLITACKIYARVILEMCREAPFDT